MLDGAAQLTNENFFVRTRELNKWDEFETFRNN